MAQRTVRPNAALRHRAHRLKDENGSQDKVQLGVALDLLPLDLRERAALRVRIQQHAKSKIRQSLRNHDESQLIRSNTFKKRFIARELTFSATPV
jgi:hypothetical protein